MTTIANWKHLISPWMMYVHMIIAYTWSNIMCVFYLVVFSVNKTFFIRPLFVIPVIEALVSVLLTLLSLPPRGKLLIIT